MHYPSAQPHCHLEVRRLVVNDGACVRDYVYDFTQQTGRQIRTRNQKKELSCSCGSICATRTIPQESRTENYITAEGVP